ncbi:hypothetical protein ACFV2N_11945 [Streptomyces sp. NPDC059680]
MVWPQAPVLPSVTRAVIAIDDSELPAEHPVLNQLHATYLSIPGEAL